MSLQHQDVFEPYYARSQEGKEDGTISRIPKKKPDVADKTEDRQVETR